MLIINWSQQGSGRGRENQTARMLKKVLSIYALLFTSVLYLPLLQIASLSIGGTPADLGGDQVTSTAATYTNQFLSVIATVCQVAAGFMLKYYGGYSPVIPQKNL